MENLKAFELAKELDVLPLDLMDKIREWKLPINSHMAQLNSEQISFIRERASEIKKKSHHSKQKEEFSNTSEKTDDEKFNESYDKKNPNYSATLNIALIGKVASGKSSLLNALLERDRSNKIAKVSAEAGTTVNIRPLKFGSENVVIYDSPGLDDIKSINSEATKDFLKNIDIGLFVVHDAADASQQKSFEDLQKVTKKTFVILNKIDVWDHLKTIDPIVDQWKNSLNCSVIYPTCAKGYDDNAKDDVPLDIRGVDELRADLLAFLESEGKAIHLAKHLKKKESYVYKIIATALIAVAIEAFIPGSAAYITATQVVAIGSIYYVMTGVVLSKSSILPLLPRFLAQELGLTLFLWVKSFLPPNGVVDVAAAGIAVTITFAMLATVYQMLKSGFSLDDNEKLKSIFGDFNKKSKILLDIFKSLKLEDLKNPNKTIPKVIEAIQKIIEG